MKTKGLLSGEQPSEKDPLLTKVNTKAKSKKGLVPRVNTEVSTRKLQGTKGLLG